MQPDQGPLRREGARPLLAVYFPLADPEFPLVWLNVYAQCGVDIVEFGWPARDPYLDGPEVAASMARARREDATGALRAALRRLATLRGAPRALLMTYCEPGHPGLDNADVLEGLDGLLAVARPRDPLRQRLEASALRAGVALAAFTPLPIEEDDVAAARAAHFYTMLQAAPGVTGARASLDPENGARIADLRHAGVAGRILLGFGISNGEQARKAVEFGADGIVVGSAALRAGRQGRPALEALLQDFRNGLNG